MHLLRKKRLVFISSLALGACLIVGLTLLALRQNLNIFITPSDVMNGAVPENQTIRVGGLVLKGSVKRVPDSLEVSFVITDTKNELVVIYRGILPDLFREGQGIIAKGRMDASHQFIADEVLAKHDEKYMPPEVAKALEEAGHPGSANTKTSQGNY